MPPNTPARSTPYGLPTRRLVAFLSALMLPVALPAQDSTAGKAPAGIYTDEQAARGNAVFGRVCVECHTTKDMSGADFRLNWNGRTVFDLFERIRTTMPEAAPGSLTREEYADVTSYFLKLNGMPTGSMPMPGDSSLVNVKLEIPPTPPSSLVLRPGARFHAPLAVSARHRAPAHATPRAGLRTAPHLPSRSAHSFLFRGL